MTTNENTPLAQQHKRSPIHFGLRVVTAMMFLALFAVSSAFGQTATYSDSWVVDNSGGSYDPINDVYNLPENSGQDEMAGVGVTDTDYDGTSETVTTTITAPNGASASATSYDPYYGRAEVTLPYTEGAVPEDGSETQYTVSTEHRYYEDYQYPCYSGGICPAAYKPSSALPFRRYFRVFTRFLLTISLRQTFYRLDGRTTYSCIYRVDCPEGRTCGYNSVYYYFSGAGGLPCSPYLRLRFLFVNRRYCVEGYYTFFDTLGGCV
ncbi:MAG: hypothetical protein ACR2LC_16045 [Pyrinomonadaceae bacterium]